jgi:hypothetical protein
MLPYDGSPGGNALGAQIDAERLRVHNEITSSNSSDWKQPRTSLQLGAYFLALGIFLFVLLY